MNHSRRLPLLVLTAAVFLGGPPAAAHGALTLNPTTLNFGLQSPGATSAPQSTTLTLTCDNGLACMLTPAVFATAISTSAGFTQTNNCPPTMSAMDVEACVINVSFAPAAVGAAAGTLSTGTGGPTAQLNGTGFAASTGKPGAPRPKCKRKQGKKKKKKKRCKKKL